MQPPHQTLSGTGFGVTYEGLKPHFFVLARVILCFGVTYEGLKLFQPENRSGRGTLVLELPMRV